MLNTFYRFLEHYRLKSNDPYAKTKTTHVSIGNPKGKYHVPDDKLGIFTQVYVRSIMNGEHIHLNESAKDPVTGNTVDKLKIRIDLDIKQSIDCSERQVKVEHLIKFVTKYTELIKKYMDVESKHLYAYVTIRTKPYRFNGNYHDGVHIMYPHITCNTAIQMMIRDDMLAEMPRIFDGINIKNNYIDMFDQQVVKSQNWLLYGSSKTKQNKDHTQMILEPYLLTHIISSTGKLVKITERHTIRYLTKLLMIRGNFNVYEPRKEYQDILDARKIPKKPNNTVDGTFILQNDKNNQSFDQDGTVMFQSPSTNENLTPEKYDEISQLVGMLSYDRAFYYKDWIDVGLCLKHIDPILLSLWDKFSQRCGDKYHVGECAEKWNSFKSSNILKNDRFFKEGTLHMWAKQDNPQAYSEYINGDSLIAKIKKACEDQSNTNVAEILHHTCKYKFCCSQYKHDRWYEYHEHHWHVSDGGVGIMTQLSLQIRMSITRYAVDCNKKMLENVTDETITSQYIEYVRKAMELLGGKKLGNHRFKTEVMSECKCYFYNKEFEEKLDEHRHLVGFNNGVYDLRKDEFRDGHPDDYISFSTGIDYVEVDEDDPRIEQVNKFMSELFPDEELCAYVWRLLSTFVSGERIGDAMFPIFTGVGCHAKGTEIRMYEGTTKRVEDIVVDDKLMGDDSTPRNVLSLKRGIGDMYVVNPIKGDSYIVNGDHILCLKASTIESIAYIKKEKKWTVHWNERDVNGYPVNKGVHFPHKYAGKKQYRKNVRYYETKQDAYDSAVEHLHNVKKSDNFIKKGDIIEIPVEKYIDCKKRLGERNYFAYRIAVNYPSRNVDLDPYMLGYWIGDGTSANTSITTMDQEVVDYYIRKITEMGMKVGSTSTKSKATTYSFVSTTKKKGDNPFRNALTKYNLINNKHIPNDYMYNDRNTRLHLLAGIIDSDGYYQKAMNQYEITMKPEIIIDGIVDISRSLGFACYKKQVKKYCIHNGNKVEETYYRVNICGEHINEIPVLLKRKQSHECLKNKDPLLYGIKLEKLKRDNYYGFELNGNHRYLLKDYTVTHNSNGKSKLIELLHMVMGNYCQKINITQLTQNRKHGANANSELAMTKGKRFLHADETDDNNELQLGFMKELTGGDQISTRGLYKDQMWFTPQFTLILLCNILPKIRSDDEGTWRRILVVPFMSRFVDNPDPNDPYQHKKDLRLTEKMHTWKEVFMYVLLSYFKLVKKEGLHPPPVVVQASEEYRIQNDIVGEFVSECIAQKEGGHIGIGRIHSHYKTWMKIAHQGAEVLSQNVFSKAFKNKVPNHSMTGRGITNIELISPWEEDGNEIPDDPVI
jgi:P4 family phage/plasmid primase-like protien